jgi:hypothetical protein
VRLGEPYRTMLGHFRHEAGHYYQNILVETGPGAQRYLERRRDLFGDERAGYADAPIERLLFDWKWMSLFFNRVNTAMSKNPLYPFEISTPVADKLGFVHQVLRESAADTRTV